MNSLTPPLQIEIGKEGHAMRNRDWT